MILLGQIVLSQIKSAKNEKEIETVVERSIQKLKIKNVNGHIVQRFVLKMGSSLRRAKTEPETEKIKQNISFAIDLFDRLQRV